MQMYRNDILKYHGVKPCSLCETNSMVKRQTRPLIIPIREISTQK